MTVLSTYFLEFSDMDCLKKFARLLKIPIRANLTFNCKSRANLPKHIKFLKDDSEIYYDFLNVSTFIFFSNYSNKTSRLHTRD